jgi:hypothetical protein
VTSAWQALTSSLSANEKARDCGLFHYQASDGTPYFIGRRHSHLHLLSKNH